MPKKITIRATTGQNDYIATASSLRAALIDIKKQQYQGWYKLTLRIDIFNINQPIEITWYNGDTIKSIINKIESC